MLGHSRKIEKVLGQKIAPPKLTFGAFVAVFKYAVLPFFLILGGLDMLGYLYFKYALDRCYGVLCVFQ